MRKWEEQEQERIARQKEEEQRMKELLHVPGSTFRSKFIDGDIPLDDCDVLSEGSDVDYLPQVDAKTLKQLYKVDIES